MNFKYYFLLILLACSMQWNAVAQQNQQGKDFFKVKAPDIKYNTLDQDESLFEENIVDSTEITEEQGADFNPLKNPSIIDEDTTYLGDEDGDGEEDPEGETAIVEVAEEMKIDSNWLTIAEYYAIWDSKTVDPYKIDPSDFKDTLNIVLYDSLSGQSWSMPMKPCRVTSHFGARWHRWHYGTDIDVEIGDPIYATFDGVVRISRYNPGGYGNYIMIRHYNGLETLYGHMSALKVNVGDYVKAGDIIGLGGNTGRSTGPHLHFEVRYAGNAFDATSVFDFPNQKLLSQRFTLSPKHYSYSKVARKVYYHKVKSGETLGAISRKYGVPVSRLRKLNRLGSSSIIRPGQRIRLR
jgi:murein DD-endopeptidase MepM/ murein hydrolase activator NlpD